MKVSVHWLCSALVGGVLIGGWIVNLKAESAIAALDKKEHSYDDLQLLDQVRDQKLHELRRVYFEEHHRSFSSAASDERVVNGHLVACARAGS
jgi:hypothetical protein